MRDLFIIEHLSKVSTSLSKVIGMSRKIPLRAFAVKHNK